MKSLGMALTYFFNPALGSNLTELRNYRDQPTRIDVLEPAIVAPACPHHRIRGHSIKDCLFIYMYILIRR